MSAGNSKKRRRSTVGLFALALTGTAAIGLSAIAVPFVTPALRKHCLPYVPATKSQIDNVVSALRTATARETLKASAIKNGEPKSDIRRTVVDLGSGDGRIVIAAAQQGFIAAGLELNYWLVLYSRLAAWKCGVHTQSSFQRADIWKANVSKYDAIVVFGVSEMMDSLRSKLWKEMKDDSHVVVCRFPIDGCMPITIFGEGIDTVWLYDKTSLQANTTNTYIPQ